MDTHSPLSPLDVITSALAWWHEAGVTHMFNDLPHHWLSPSPEESLFESRGEHANTPKGESRILPHQAADKPPAKSRSLKSTGPSDHRATWPSDLADFQSWWLTDCALNLDDLHNSANQQRVPPHGPHRPKLMVVVMQPEAGDTNHLLSGEQGLLLRAILKAISIALHEKFDLFAEQVYVASLLPAHSHTADGRDLGAQGWGQLLTHHIGLVMPERLMTFGQGISSLLGHDPTQISSSVSFSGVEGSAIPWLPTRELALLQQRLPARAAFWRRWLDWNALAGADQAP